MATGLISSVHDLAKHVTPQQIVHHATPPAIVVIVVTLAFLAVAVTSYAPPLWASLGAAALTRIVFAAMTSKHFTPGDVRNYFHSTGQLVLDGKDPLQHLPGRQWNFLEVMPYIHALEIKTGLSWVNAVKIAPIAADLVVVWLVCVIAGWSANATPRTARSRALLYALNPLSLFIVSLHGQVEPVALALALGGLVLARREYWLLAGVLVGAAIATKTWPLLIGVAIAPWSRPKQIAKFVAGGVVVPVVMLVSGVLFLDTSPVHDLKHIATYSSYVSLWGWSGVLAMLGYHNVVGYTSRLGHLGSALTALGAVAALVVFRSRPLEQRALVALSAVLIVTAGFGPQYLLWVAPLTLAVAGIVVAVQYVLSATLFAAVFYFVIPESQAKDNYLRGLSWLVILALGYLVVDVWRRGSEIIGQPATATEVGA